MTENVRIGLVGIGEISLLHASAYAGVEGVDLCAAAGRAPENARRLANEESLDLYESYDALLGDGSVDGVDICVPNHLHAEFAVKALEAGKHVLCEKPIALTIGDARLMIDSAARAKRILLIGHVLRFWPEYVKIKELIESRRLGKPLLASGRRLTSLMSGTKGAEGWRHDPARSGGAVLDMQIHDMDFYAWLFGSPNWISAQGVPSPDGALNHLFTLASFPGGEKAFIESSAMMAGNPLDIQCHVLGTRASVEYKFSPAEMPLHGIRTRETHGPGPSLILYEPGREPEDLYTPREDSFSVALREEVGYFASCIRSGSDPLRVMPEDSLLSLNLAIASRTAHETGQPVTDFP